MAERDETLRWIQEISFFDGFSPEEIQRISDFKNHILSYKQGQIIVRQNDTDLSLFILLQGSAVITKNEKPQRVLASLTVGSVFGEVSFINPRPRTTSVVAVTKSMVLKIDSEMFETLTPTAQGKIKDRIINMLINRLDGINNAILTNAR